jgi:hypothetical protein
VLNQKVNNQEIEIMKHRINILQMEDSKFKKKVNIELIKKKKI